MTTEENTNEQGNTNESDDIRQLRAKAKQADDYAKEIAAYKQKDAIREAGLSDLTPEQINALSKVHEGESTPESIRKTAESLKFVEPVTDTSQAEAQQHDQFQAASRGAQATDVSSYEAEVAAANTPQELEAVQTKYDKPFK